jgi:hypothetical protein
VQKRIGALLVASLIGLGGASNIGRSQAQEGAADVAYVETVSGNVVSTAQGKPALLDVLDTIGDRTRLDLTANSELRLCHYQLRKLVSLKGPLRVSVSASGVTVENGKAAAPSAETCAVPVVSTLQGGFVSRNIGAGATNVPLRPSIKVVNQGTKAIRQIALWDSARRTLLATFERNAARPQLEDGQSYLLVVEQADGGELKMVLQAAAGTRTGPLIVNVR